MAARSAAGAGALGAPSAFPVPQDRPRVFLRRFLLLFLVACAAPALGRAQAGVGGDTVAAPPGIRLPASARPAIRWETPPSLLPFGRYALRAAPTDSTARRVAEAIAERVEARNRALWLRSVRLARDARAVGLQDPGYVLGDPIPPDSSFGALFADLLGDYADIDLQFLGRFEAKVDRFKNERCTASQLFAATQQCQGAFQPAFDFQFQTRMAGTIASRVFLNVDYDSQREFDASNNISVYYQGRTDEFIERLEVGNVSLTLPPSQFITGGIPQGNYGAQATGQLGPVRFSTILAQQRGNVSKDNQFRVGDRALSAEDREIEDYQVEARRFFFTVDPLLFGDAYPNIDILNGTQMRQLAEALPDSVRPRRLSVYRVVLGGQPPNPNGPRFRIIGDPNSRAGQVYELLRENVDFYADPSQMWIALTRPPNLQNERYVIAYTVRINGRDTTITSTGGTPDVEFVSTRDQFANLLWDPQVRPTDPAARREIRSVYRVSGEDLRRGTVQVRILTGAGAGQEKPLAGNAETYLQMFGLAQSGNAALFDIENRLWPRPGDPNVAIGGTANAKLIRDYFLVFPSVRPFARDGLIVPGNPVSDTIYLTPSEDLYSPLHPQSQYRIRLAYEIEGGGAVGSLSLNAIQLRPFSEVVAIDGVVLRRDDDYTIDYEIGQIAFNRPDTLFPVARTVSVRYEENPLFAAAPTNVLGFTGSIPLERGMIDLIAVSQTQRTNFTRPPLGYEPQSSLIAGASGRFSFDAAPLSRWLEKLPTVRSTTLSRVDFATEIATSRPQPNAAGQAYVESFESEGGTGLPAAEAAWYFSSQPALGSRLPQLIASPLLDLDRASTMAWQNAGVSRTGQPINFTFDQIDPQVRLTGTGFQAPEQILWLTLYPLSTGGLLNSATNEFQWKVDNTPTGRRWRSLRTVLSPAGVDLSRVEQLQFWTLVDTTALGRGANPTLVFDFGEISENSVSFGPSLLTLTSRPGGGLDSLFTGKRLLGFDQMDSERDPLSRAFNQATDDRGLPGDRLPSLEIIRNGELDIVTDFATCRRGAFQLLLLGDARANCTVQNGRLDEEDIDLDLTLNLTAAQREDERVRRYIINLADPSSFARVGNCNLAAVDTTVAGGGTSAPLCWVLVRVPFRAPDDSLNGGPNLRRIRAARITMISGEGLADEGFSTIPLARMQLLGSPWLKRGDRTVRGIAGEEAGGGYMLASVIGTQDRDTLRGVDYESPPGIGDAAETQQTGLENTAQQINERALRILAGGIEQGDRAEAFFRFAEGSKNFMTYRELRVWARGNGAGWGQDGELQFYIKIGRDQNNFYLYRTPVNSGRGRATWLPEVRVDFRQLFDLREELQNNFLQASPDSLACTGIDSLMIARSGVPVGQPINRFAVCRNGYIVYSLDPAINPPNLAAVQELAVGIVRVGVGGGSQPIMPTDTLELWVNDIRLTDVEKTPGYAGQLSLNVTAGDIATIRFNASRVDGNFRQLSELPSFVGSDAMSIGTSVRLERLLPGVANFSIPFSINHSTSASEPIFVQQSDIRGSGIRGLRTPRRSATNYSLGLRRVVPMERGGVLPVLLNNLSLNGTYGTSSNRSEFADGGSSIWNATVDYNLQAGSRLAGLPTWITERLPAWGVFSGLRTGALRWTPTQVRFNSTIGRTIDRRTTFLRPAATELDTGRVVGGLNALWRTQAAIEFRPTTALQARWDFTSVRDLRRYGDTTAIAIVAGGERQRFLGTDIGLERERQMNANITYEPQVATWLRPRVTLGSTYSMIRDPQSRQLVRALDSLGAFRLPRRLSGSQTISAATSVDMGRAIAAARGDRPWIKRLTEIVRPIDVSYTRGINSIFDGAPFTPGLGYQFALGGLEQFRAVDDRSATAAGFTEASAITGSLVLPGELTLNGRAQRAGTRNFVRRLDNTQAAVDGAQLTLPDLTLRWSYSPRGWLQRIISGFGTNVGYVQTRQTSVDRGLDPTAEPDIRTGRVWQYPTNTAITWAFLGNLRTQAGYSRGLRIDSLPGSVNESRTEAISADVQRFVTVPDSWGFRGQLNTRVNYSKETASTFVTVRGDDLRSRLADNGRQAISMSAETEVAANVSFSLQLSHVLNYDNNFNRRDTQFVVTTSFVVQFFANNAR
jgi:hypothetical protein